MKNKVIGVLMAVVMAAGLIGCSPAVNQGGDEELRQQRQSQSRQKL